MSETPEWDDIAFDQMSRPNCLAESIDYENNIIASYIVKMPNKMDSFYMSQAICIEQSTGTFVPVPAETPETRRKHVAKVIGVYGLPDYEYDGAQPKEEKMRMYFIQVAFPLNLSLIHI